MTATTVSVATLEDRKAESIREVLRDIARGGLAGAIVGFIVAGLGGRIVMRLATLMVPESIGRFTENGNRIGDITVSGSVGLILFGGLFFGLFGSVVWVVVAPWIPGKGLRRAILAAPIAVALTGVALIDGRNPDFPILQHDGLIVAMLILLVSAAGLSIALVDGWLDRRLPAAGRSKVADGIYVALTLAGGLLVLPAVVPAYLVRETGLGLALVVTGLATLGLWALRLRGQVPPRWLLIVGSGALLTAVALGAIELRAEVGLAAGLP